jgi:hypothetical protein
MGCFASIARAVVCRSCRTLGVTHAHRASATAMTDRALGIAGIALGLIFAFLQYFFPSLPSWLLISGVGIGVLLLGVALGIVVADRRQARLKAPVDRVVLRLRVYPDTRLPDRVHAENIFRWYYFPGMFEVKDQGGGTVASLAIVTLFVSFEPEVKISTLKIRALEGELPTHEVKDFNQRFAIIAFMGKAPVGTIEVAVEP